VVTISSWLTSIFPWLAFMLAFILISICSKLPMNRPRISCGQQFNPTSETSSHGLVTKHRIHINN
jgi:hypothetical protein